MSLSLTDAFVDETLWQSSPWLTDIQNVAKTRCSFQLSHWKCERLIANQNHILSSTETCTPIEVL